MFQFPNFANIRASAMDELERCYEEQSLIKTYYSQTLNNLDIQYCNYIQSLLDQKESIKRELRDKYQQQLTNNLEQ